MRRWALLSGRLFGQWAEPLGGEGSPEKSGLGARGSFQVADEVVFCLGRVLQGPDDSRPGERTSLRCGRPGGLKALWCRLLGEQSALSQGPPTLFCPRPSPTGTRRPGRGQGGLEFVIPGRVCGRNAGPGIGGKGRGSRRESARFGAQWHKT